MPHPDYGERVLCPEHAEDLLSRHPDQPHAKARERSEQERGGGWGASGASVLEGGSEGKGRDTRSGSRNSRCGAVALVEDALVNWPTRCPADPATLAVLSGPCILRRLRGQAAANSAGRSDETAKPGDQQ